MVRGNNQNAGARVVDVLAGGDLISIDNSHEETEWITPGGEESYLVEPAWVSQREPDR